MSNSSYAPLGGDRTTSPSDIIGGNRVIPDTDHLLDGSNQSRARDLYVQTSGLTTPDSFGTAGVPAASQHRPVGVYLPYLSTMLLVVTIIVFYVTDSSECSQPLSGWIFGYMARHITKSILYDIRSRRILLGQELPMPLVFGLASVDLAGPILWTLGGYYIFHTSTCDTGLFVYACFLWGLQSIGILLPCFFLSTIIFCAPCLLWLAPYIIRPNPNTIATGREVMAKLNKVKYSDLASQPENGSCSICLGDYNADEVVIKLPCGHIFHSNCIESWLDVSQLCPVDRRNVAELVDAQGPAQEQV